MWLFGSRKTIAWDVASCEIGTAFTDLRTEFYERCLEALDWNVSKNIIEAPHAREALSGYTELSVVAFQILIARQVSFGQRYLNANYEEVFWGDLVPRVYGNDDKMNLQLIIDQTLRFRRLNGDAELQNISLASSIAAHFYPTGCSETTRELAIKLFAKVAPSFHLRMYATVARAFGDVKTAKKVEANIDRIRAAGAGY
jgi:hypothetical protein